MAAALGTAGAGTFTARTLPTATRLAADGKTVEITVGSQASNQLYGCDLAGEACKIIGGGGSRTQVLQTGGAPGAAGAPGGRGAGRAGGQGGGRGGGAGAMSPDGKRSAFIRDSNLWIRDVATGQETQLTMDGVKDFGYATNNAGWTKSDAPVLAWSPDSKKIATFQHDGRGVGEMYLVSTTVGHPVLQAWKYSLPGDDKIFMIERVVIDVDAKKVTRLLMPADAHRSTLCDHVVCGGSWADVQWTPPRGVIPRPSPSSASSSSRSTAWARRGDRRSSTRRTTPTWGITPCPIRWRA